MVRDSSWLDRRRLLQAGSLGGFAAFTGCLGDDEADDADDTDDTDDADDIDDPDDADDIDDPDDGDDMDDGDDTDDIDPDEQVPEVLDATASFANHHYAELPADTQYNPYADPNPPEDFPWRPAPLIGRSNYDFSHYGHLVEDWSYEPGVLQLTFHDDFYWWSGEQVTVDDFLNQLEYEDYLWGDDDLDYHVDIVSMERIDDLTARLAVVDAWHEDWAIYQTVENFLINMSRNVSDGWIEEFGDAPDLDAIEDLREEHEEQFIESDEELAELFYSIYEFRLDGAVGEVGEDYWQFELVQEKNGNLRHHANYDNREHLPNFRYARYEVHEEHDVLTTERYQEQVQPFVGPEAPETLEQAVAGEFDFEIEQIEYFRPPNTIGGIQFNHDVHPSDDVHFRRAFAYLVDNTAWEGYIENIPIESNHPYFSDDELEMYVSDAVIDAFTDYGWDEMRFDEAEAELEAGGYERNADGRWLLQEDGVEGDAGEPMEFEFSTHDWMGWVPEYGTDWYADMDDFGIGLETLLELPEDWTVLFTYTGGGTPEHALGNVYLDEDWARPEYNIPSTVLAPEFLETAGPGDPTDDWVEYEVATMTERLTVTTDEEMHQELVDELTWVVNQAVNHYGVSPGGQIVCLNQEEWFWPPLEEVPATHSDVVFRTVHFGNCMYDG